MAKSLYKLTIIALKFYKIAGYKEVTAEKIGDELRLEHEIGPFPHDENLLHLYGDKKTFTDMEKDVSDLLPELKDEDGFENINGFTVRRDSKLRKVRSLTAKEILHGNKVPVKICYYLYVQFYQYKQKE